MDKRRTNVAYWLQNCASCRSCPTQLVSRRSPHLNHASSLSKTFKQRNRLIHSSTPA